MQWRVTQGMMWIKRLFGSACFLSINGRHDTYLTTLSIEWKTSEFRHMIMAMALLPMIRQYVAMNRRFDWGNTHILSTARMLTK